MSDPAQINRSLGTIRTELEYLAAAGVLSPPQLQSSKMASPPFTSIPDTFQEVTSSTRL
jgi:hypothetical protein